MTATPGNPAIEACKRRLEAALSVIEAITEASKNMRAAQAGIVKRLSRQSGFPVPQAPAITGAPHLPLVEMMDTACKRWLETTRRFYAAPMASAPQVRQPT